MNELELELEFEFAKYTEVTDLALELNSSYSESKGCPYVRFFICEDVWDIWYVRIQANTNEEYEYEEGCYIMERNNIEKRSKSDNLTLKKVKEIIENDDFSNYDVYEGFDIEDLIDDLDDGFGINNRKELV